MLRPRPAEEVNVAAVMPAVEHAQIILGQTHTYIERAVFTDNLLTQEERDEAWERLLEAKKQIDRAVHEMAD